MEDQTAPEQLRDAFRVLANDKVISCTLIMRRQLSYRDTAVRHRTGSSVGTGSSAFDRLSERSDSISERRGWRTGV